MDPKQRRNRRAAGLDAEPYRKDRFNELELTKFRECFTFFDKFGDGNLLTQDIGLALRAMGALINERDIILLTKKYDPTKSGKVSFDDYVNMMSEVVDKPDNPDLIKQSFSCFDKSQTGRLDIDEMKHVLTRIGDVLSPEEIQNFMAILDTYSDNHAR